MIHNSTPPRPDELEVSIFGPGYGECIVLHLGNNEWAVVDSCIDAETRSPVALDYLSALGIDVSSRLKLIVATHFHNDHCRGLSRIVKSASDAKIVFSAALRNDEFLELVEAQDKLYNHRLNSGIREFSEIFETLQSRNRNQLDWALSNRLIYRSTSKNIKHDCQIHSLSPSDCSLTRSLKSLARLLPNEKQPKRCIPDIKPNDASVVLWIRFGHVNILLGADLENTNDQQFGWNAVLNSNLRPGGKAKIYKIAHHGSQTADNEKIWSMLLKKNPYAALTSWFRGKNSLPSAADINRIKSFTNRLYLTSPHPSIIKRSNGVEKMIAAKQHDFHVREGKMGQVRFRIPFSADTPTVNVQLFGASSEIA